MSEKSSFKTRFYVREMGRGEITHLDTAKSIMASDQHQEIVARAMLIDTSFGEELELVDVKSGYENTEPFSKMIAKQEKVNIVDNVSHETVLVTAMAQMLLRVADKLTRESDAAVQTNS